MLNLPCWLLPVMLAGGTAPIVPATPPPAVVDLGSTASLTAVLPDAQSSSSGSGASAPQHVFGFGGALGAGALGTGLLTRYWFLNFVGLDFRFLLSSNNYGVGFGTGGGFSYEVAPSVIVMLTKADASKPVVFRPYLGVGVNHTHAGSNAVSTASPVSGSGEQIFGGVEVQIQQVGGFAISGEVVYNKRDATLVNAGLASGTTGDISFMFYVK